MILNTDLIITPYKGVGPILFGMTREEIRVIIDGSVTNINRNRTDYFENIHIEYDRDICRAIILLPPMKPSFRGINLLGNQSIKQLRAWLESINGLIQDDITGGITAFRFGISLYTPDIDIFQDDPPESITVFRVGYFDEFASSKTLDFRDRLNKVYKENHNCIPDDMNMDNL
jgi:hypothetical protein